MQQVSCKDALCHQPKSWSTNRTVTVWQTMQVLSDKLTSHCVTSYLSALVISKTNSYATSRFNYKLQLRYQQVLDALSHQPKGWSTNRAVTVWQTMQVLSDKLTSHCVTSYLSALVTSKTNSYATSRFNYKLQADWPAATASHCLTMHDKLRAHCVTT